jgi:transcriptional regulator with XRE-family HTH domain
MASTAPPRTERKVLPGAVKRLREAYGYKLDPISKKAGVSAGYWCNIEAGRKAPTVAVMIAMARALGVDLDDITYVVDASEQDAA